MKKYCENVVNKTEYLDYTYNSNNNDDSDNNDDYYIDYQEVNSKIVSTIKLEHAIHEFQEEKYDFNNDDKINFTIGNDFFVVFTISKIYNNNH